MNLLIFRKAKPFDVESLDSTYSTLLRKTWSRLRGGVLLVEIAQIQIASGTQMTVLSFGDLHNLGHVLSNLEPSDRMATDLLIV